MKKTAASCTYRFYVAFKRAALKYQALAAALRTKAKHADEKARKEVYRLNGSGQWKFAKDTVANKVTKPLQAVRRLKAGPQGQLKGTIEVKPKEVDKIIKLVYGKIYAGNSRDHRKQLD